MTDKHTDKPKGPPVKQNAEIPPHLLPPCALEKPFWKSKKFIAYMTAEIGWKAALFMMIYLHASSFQEATAMLTIIFVSGFVQVTFIGGQAALDKYVRVAQVMHGVEQSEKETSE
jgi:hypothetical protein